MFLTTSVGRVERRLVGAAGPASEEEDAGADQRGPQPLLDRIRRDRQELEAKIDKLKGYISASSEMMNKLKGLPLQASVFDDVDVSARQDALLRLQGLNQSGDGLVP
ncbi:hypothetical protein FJT64_023836 [Amphibalanus amphitrite]|uniref:Uncharacterized protein n=1 Tax=Amphibalanus amphitrite TaxID=1232801 RepID=A0A6A4WGG7_AMPAM|nr:hypothetical protein FJT64_023836 [Amphibalanus amphitrite]